MLGYFLAYCILSHNKIKEIMKISCWGDLALFISHMSASEKREPIRIVVDDRPIVIAKEIDRAKDYYVRPRSVNIIGYEQKEVELAGHFHVGEWERTMNKGDLFISAY